MTDVWDLYSDLSAKDPASLTPEQQHLVVVLDFRQEVNAGGFDNYFRAWGGNSAPQAVVALADLLGPEWSEMLSEGMQMLGEPYPDDPGARADQLDQSDLDQALEQLDGRFYALEESADADGRLNEYIEANPRLRG